MTEDTELTDAQFTFVRGTREIADLLGLNQRTVLHLIWNGELPALVLNDDRAPGSTLYVRRAALLEWIKTREAEAVAERKASLQRIPAR